MLPTSAVWATLCPQLNPNYQTQDALPLFKMDISPHSQKSSTGELVYPHTVLRSQEEGGTQELASPRKSLARVASCVHAHRSPYFNGLHLGATLCFYEFSISSASLYPEFGVAVGNMHNPREG